MEMISAGSQLRGRLIALDAPTKALRINACDG